MSKLPSITATEAARAFEKAGFLYVRTAGSHMIYKKAEHRFNLSIPCHSGKSLASGTLRSLIRAAGLSVEQFVENLS